jgi:hypothetical protein
MPQSLSQLHVHLAFGAKHREPLRRGCISPLQGFEIEGATLTQAVGLGCDRSPLWGLSQTLCAPHVAANDHAANKGDEDVETPRAGAGRPRHRGRDARATRGTCIATDI